jgi:hypothetical protein
MNTVSGNETAHGVSNLNCFCLLSLVISFRDRMSHLRCFLSKPLRMNSPSKVFTRLNAIYICPAQKFPVVSMTNWSTVFPWALWIVVPHARTKGNCLRVTGPCLTCTSCNSMGVELSSGECIHKMCGRTYGQTNMKRAITFAKINHEIGIICACSDHGQSRCQIWIKCDKRQMTSCIHKMCGRTYGQTNMKRATTLAKINHPWNQYNMHMLRSWPTKKPNMNKMRQKTND